MESFYACPSNDNDSSFFRPPVSLRLSPTSRWPDPGDCHPRNQGSAQADPAAEDLASNTLRVGCFLFHEPVTLCISFLLTRLLLEVRELFRQRLYLVRVPSASQCKDQVVERCLIRR